MRSRILSIFCLFTCCLFIPGIVAAELSVANQWRLEQATHRCGKMDNALTFPEYWNDSVTDENRETVCMAEQFAKIAAEDGEKWLQYRSVEFIDKCRELSAKDKTKYYQCLQEGVKTITKQVSSPCKELGDEGLWDEARCGRLISYIFTRSFNKVLLDNRPIVEKAMDNKILKILFGPIAATILLLLYVLDVVLLTDPGNWWRIPKFGLVVGTIILVSWFLPDQWGFLGVGAAVFICVGGLIRNHTMVLFKSDKKKKTKYQKRWG